MTLCLRYRKTLPGGQAPARAHADDAGYDLTAAAVHHAANGDLVVDFGIALEIPEGYVGLIFPRSSIAKTRHQMRNHVGVIDPGYRGSVLAKFGSLLHDSPLYGVGERCAQLLIVPCCTVDWQEASSLPDTARGAGGFGSSGQT